MPPEHRADLTPLRTAIRSGARDRKPSIQHGIIGYGTYRYKHPSGREGDASVARLASPKNHISLCLGCATDDEGYLPDKKKERLGNGSVGRRCIRFKDLKLQVAMELMKQAARAAR